MEEYQVVPKIIPEVPKKALVVKYGDINVTPGKELTPTQVQKVPQITWIAEENTYYTLLFIDPDVPPSFNFKQFTHWLVVNIPGNDINAGNHIFDYLGSGASQGSGLHRYIFILYKQSGKLDSTLVNSIKDETMTDRAEFQISDLQEKNKLVGPIAANFFRAQYDDYVPLLMGKLKERYNF